MHDRRTSTALRLLADLGTEPDPPRWSWAIARLEATGRIAVPADARVALGAPAGERIVVRGTCHRVALVLHPTGAGAPMPIDGRGRLRIPAWLRRGHPDALLVASRTAEALAVIAPTALLDNLGDVLAGESR